MADSDEKSVSLSPTELKDLLSAVGTNPLANQGDQAAPAVAQQPAAQNAQQPPQGQLSVPGLAVTVPQQGPATATDLSQPQAPAQAPTAAALPQTPDAPASARPQTDQDAVLPSLAALPTKTAADKIAALSSANKAELTSKEFEAKAKQAEADSELERIVAGPTTRKAQQMLTVAQDYQKQTQKVAQDYENQIAGELHNYQTAVQDFQKTGNSGFSSPSTAWSIGAAIFAGINQLGMGIVGNNGPNQVLQMINQRREQDLKRQELLLNTKGKSAELQGTLLGHMMSIYKDKDVALKAANAASVDLVNAQFQDQLAKTAPAQVAAHAQSVQQGLQAEQAKAQAQLTDAIATKGFEATRLDMTAAQERARNEIERQKLQTKVANSTGSGLFGEIPDKAVRKDATTAFNALNDSIIPGYQRLQEALNKPASERASFDTYNQIKDAKALIIKGIQEAKTSGRSSKINNDLAAAEAGLNNNNLLDLVRGGDASKTAKEGAENLIRKINGQLKESTGKDFADWHKKLEESESQ